MSIKLNDKVYRNTQEQVLKNAEDIEELKAGTILIPDGAVTAPKIAGNAVTTDKLALNAVSTEKIQDEAITSAKIKNKAVTDDKLDENIIRAYYKGLYNLGYYDTLSGNVITRQTGYLYLNKSNANWNLNGNETIYYTNIVSNVIDKPSNDNVLGKIVCPTLETVTVNNLYFEEKLSGIAINSTGSIGISTSDYADLTEIVIQYKLATSYTEEVIDKQPLGITRKEVEPVLLWKNATPSVDFASGDITASENPLNYKYIVVIFKTYKTNDEIKIQKFGSVAGTTSFNGTFYTSSKLLNIARNITFTNSTTISLDAGVYQEEGVTGTSNGVAIPIAIYGTNLL